MDDIIFMKQKIKNLSYNCYEKNNNKVQKLCNKPCFVLYVIFYCLSIVMISKNGQDLPWDFQQRKIHFTDQKVFVKKRDHTFSQKSLL